MTQPSKNTSMLENVSRETFEGLKNYVALLLKWNQKINLIGPATESDIWSRHIEDCLQLVRHIPTRAKTLADFGSGGGLPGLVIALARPDLTITLVEVDQRKSAFLNEAKRLLGLSNVTVEAKHSDGIEGQFDIITARALSSLSNLLGMIDNHIHVDSLAIFPKGEQVAAELADAEKTWQFNHQQFSSVTNEKSSIITIAELKAK